MFEDEFDRWTVRGVNHRACDAPYGSTDDVSTSVTEAG